MNDRRAIVVFTEGDFEDVFTRSTLAEAHAFAEGIAEGAGYYGAGSCKAFVLPDDEGALWAEAKDHESDIDAEQLNKALVAAAEALENARLASEHD